ncbi:hypothetical protein ATB53_05330 [Xanthomonas translucens]|uniref:Uncharacterized protein n=1 Tax=Xanthomonas campestris pv. translucens TaxID=343 RepID=A0A120EW23_XANCT|nr:hypothetical protein ATB53_05330 [Xanthomonas translucens]
MRRNIASAFKHAPNGNVDAVLKKNIVRHVLIVLTCLMVRLHYGNAIQLATQRLGLWVASITMQNQGRHGGTMLSLTGLVSSL